jgi:hypothetical protein
VLQPKHVHMFRSAISVSLDREYLATDVPCCCLKWLLVQKKLSIVGQSINGRSDHMSTTTQDRIEPGQTTLQFIRTPSRNPTASTAPETDEQPEPLNEVRNSVGPPKEAFAVPKLAHLLSCCADLNIRMYTYSPKHWMSFSKTSQQSQPRMEYPTFKCQMIGQSH